MHGIDAFAIYSETPTSPFVTLKVAIYRPTVESDGPDAAELRSFVRDRVVRLGPGVADQRVVRVPGDLHHPMWVTDPDYSPDDHIHHVALPAPGDKAALCDFLSDLMGRPLDPERPLWEVWVIEGLEDDRLAVAAKVHHALADGKTTARLIAEAHRPADGAGPTETTSGATVPGTVDLIGRGLVDLAKTYVDELPAFVRDVRRFRRDHDTSAPETDEAPAERGPVPHTVLNGLGGRYRLYRYEMFPLDEIKALAHSFECTINTLVLGICSEALARYLTEVDEAPSGSLVASMPVGEPDAPSHTTRLHREPPHNSVAAPRLPLHQEIDDFAERLEAIARSSAAAVDEVRRSFGHRFDNFLEFLPGSAIRRVHAAMARRERSGKLPYSNVVISNVAGPREPLYALDGRLEMTELLSTGNIADVGHLNITVWSYVDNFTFSFYMRKGALPDPERIPAAVREVVEELRTRLDAEAPATP